ncbi:MAG: DUF1302 domain-containing protein, partial [Pseudomonas sp.]
MQRTTRTNLRTLGFAMLGGTGVALMPLASALAEEETRYTGYYENATHVRDSAGLSKFRNTLQLNADRVLEDRGAFRNIKFHGTFRGTYDGVYDLNSSEYGSGAGGAIQLENTAGGNS